MITETLITQLENLFSSREDVAFSLLFGSAASGRLTDDSDVDVAVYFRPAGAPAERQRSFDLEEPGKAFAGEEELWAECERTCERTVDLVVLNHVAATVAAGAVLTGRTLSMNDRVLYLRFSAAATALAEEFREFTEDFVRIKARSQSLSDLDQGRLVRIADYLRTELSDAALYTDLDSQKYTADAHYRRAVERWVENLVNASIDAAKIVLASESMAAPQTYHATMEGLASISEFAGVATRLASNTRVRNVLAHEYLDLRYTQTAAVVSDAEAVYGGLLDALERWMG